MTASGRKDLPPSLRPQKGGGEGARPCAPSRFNSEPSEWGEMCLGHLRHIQPLPGDRHTHLQSVFGMFLCNLLASLLLGFGNTET